MFGAEGLKKKKKAEDVDLDITPMIDVTFLLLIFFMVTSTMQATPDLDVPPTRHGEGVDKTLSTEIMIAASKTSGGEASITLDGREASLEEVKEFVKKGVEDNKRNAIIMADREVREGVVMEVEKALAEIEGLSIHVGVRDKN